MTNLINFEVYFDIYGKAMKTTVMAGNEIEAVEAVKAKLKIHRVVKKKDDFNDAMDFLNRIVDPKK